LWIVTSDGTPDGAEFQVNTFPGVGSDIVDVASDANGDFVVVWWGLSPGSDSSDVSIQARCFTSTGMPVDDQFQVNTYTTDRQDSPDVAMAPDGDFVVVWESVSQGGIAARRFDSDCTPSGDDFVVNRPVPAPTPDGWERRPRSRRRGRCAGDAVSSPARPSESPRRLVRSPGGLAWSGGSPPSSASSRA
jgi:hypothetical protein